MSEPALAPALAHQRGKGARDLHVVSVSTTNRLTAETFDEFLASENLLAPCEEDAIKEIIADQIRAAMKEQRLTKTAMAARMQTDRRQLDRLLDPANPSVTLSTLRRAATAVGRTLRVELA